jgi:hypothetical protein
VVLGSIALVILRYIWYISKVKKTHVTPDGRPFIETKDDDHDEEDEEEDDEDEKTKKKKQKNLVKIHFDTNEKDFKLGLTFQKSAPPIVIKSINETGVAAQVRQHAVLILHRQTQRLNLLSAFARVDLSADSLF